MRTRLTVCAWTLRLAVMASGALAVMAISPQAVHAQAKDKDKDKKPPAAKDPKLAEAKKLFDQGSEAYADGKYEDAVNLWLKSYDLSGKPLIFESIGNAYERMG